MQTSSDLRQHFVWVAAPTFAMGAEAPAVWLSPPMLDGLTQYWITDITT